MNVKTIILLVLIFAQATDSFRRRRRRRRSPCSLANCQVSVWSSWSICSEPCGTAGVQTRTRSVTVGASCGGSCPYSLSESQSCNNPGCHDHGVPLGSSCSCYSGWTNTCCDTKVYKPTLPPSSNEDPCHSHVEIDEPERSINYHADPSLPDVTLLCDDNLPGYQWYRFVSAAGGQMSTRDDLPQYACGTRYPLYMVGDHPTEINETIVTTACSARDNNPCFQQYDMEVKMCDGFYIYRLQSVVCPSAYCAGSEVRCPEGQNSPNGFTPGCTDAYPKITSVPEVDVDVVLQNYGGRYGEQMTILLMCRFASDTTSDKATFDVNWYVDNEYALTRTLGRSDGDNGTYTCTIDQFKHPAIGDEGLFSLGQSIRCSVTSKFNDGNIASDEKRSEDFFVGIRVHTPYVYVEENGQPVPIQFSSSVPIKCEPSVKDEDCKVEVGLDFDKNLNLGKGKLGLKKCTTDLTRDYKVNTIFSLDVLSQPTERSNDNAVYILEFSTNNNAFPSYFRNYRPEHVVVHRRGKRSSNCYGSGDPHYKTFDGSSHDWYGTGDYVMVREKVSTDGVSFSNFEVHVRLKPCGGAPWNPSCNCGVAVREGNDVAIADACNSRYGGFVYTRKTQSGDCNPAFSVSISSSGREFKVSTPSGQFVRFSYLSVYVEVNGAMYDRVEGLCGTFNGRRSDDFQYFDSRTNRYINGQCRQVRPGHCCTCMATEFARSFKLPKGTSLFYGFTPSSYKIKDVYPICQCLPAIGGSTIYCQNSFADPMTNSLGGTRKYTSICSGPRGKRDYQDEFYSDEDEYDPYAYEIPDDDFLFDPANFTWPTPSGITEDKAQERCTKAISESNIAEQCQEVEESLEATDGAIEECMYDILIMDDLSVVDTARSTMETVCLSAFAKNASLWEENEAGELAPPASIINAVCPGNCNGNGNCTLNGTCVCKEGYTAVDCGIEIGKPPDVEYIRSGSLCDTRKRPCERLTIAATGLLNSDTLTCHIRDLEYDLSNSSWIEAGKTTETVAEFASAYSAYCYVPLPRVRRQARSLDEVGQSVQAQRIALSNDGSIESTSLLLVMYDSLCINCTDSGACSQKDSACLINGKCYADNETSPFNDCLQCQVNLATDEWTILKDGTCADSSTQIDDVDYPTTQDYVQAIDFSNSVTVSIIVAVSICFIALAGVVLLFVVYVHRKKIRMNKKIGSFPSQEIAVRTTSEGRKTAWT